MISGRNCGETATNLLGNIFINQSSVPSFLLGSNSAPAMLVLRAGRRGVWPIKNNIDISTSYSFL